MAKRKRSLPRKLGVSALGLILLAGIACQSGPTNQESSGVYTPVVVRPAAAAEGPAPFEVTLSTPRPVDGSLLFLSLHPILDVDPASVKIVFEGMEYPAFTKETSKDLSSLVVIPFNSAPRQTKVEVIWAGGRSEYPLEVVDGKYPSEKLTVDENKVNPPKSVMRRILREQKEIGALYKVIAKQRYWSGPFILPIESEITSQFGNKRLYNGKMASFHQGLDLRARTPLPIRAPEGAKVVLAKDLYFTGGTVILDHGFGLFTVYAHMSRIDVSVGDKVAKSQSLGLSGGSGRASGPHLHWGAVLFKQKFNPADLTRALH